jgi:hypothetical protein
MSTITNYNKLTSQEWNALYDSLMTEKNPNTDTLKQFLDAPYKKVFTQADSEQYHYDYIKALQLKLETLTKEPTPIEKTMTRSQLYLTNNPIWTNNMRPKDIIEIIAAVPWLKNYGSENQITNMFDKIIDFNGNVNYLKLNKLYQ